MRKAAVAFLTLTLALLLGRTVWTVETEAPLGGPSAEVVIPPGASTRAIADILAAARVIPRPWSFALFVRLRGDGGRMKAGRYRFDGPYSVLDVETKLVEGVVERREVTIPEGRSMFEISEIVERGGFVSGPFLEAAKNPDPVGDLDSAAKTLEGYLFPETYDVPDGMSATALAAVMVKRARAVFDDLGLTSAGRPINGVPLTLRQIVTLASIVELETAAPEERPRIAGVFLNRLRRGMRLQTDPTVIYALKLDSRYDGNIRKADLASESPYNTYRFAGLPPGPIGSPGRSALDAVLHPEATETLYFVSRNDGTHVFSKNLRDHERAVDEFQRRRPARSTAKSPDQGSPPVK